MFDLIYLMNLFSYQIYCADSSYVTQFFFLPFFLFFLLCYVFRSGYVFVRSCFCSLCLFCTLSFLFWHFQIIKFVSLKSIQNKIKISTEIKLLLYNSLIANLDQPYHYYKILSRVIW